MMRIARRARVALLVSLAWLLAACGGAPAVTSVALPEGWQTVEQENLSLALPPGWEVVSAEDGNFEDALDELVRQNPRLGSVAQQGRAAMASGQVRLLAFDLAPEDALANFTTNLSIGEQQLEEQVSLRQVAEANERQLRTNGFGDVRRTIAKLGGEDVARLTSTLQINDAAGEPLALAIQQLILLRARRQYVLTFTTTTDESARMQPVFEQIMATLRVE